MSDVYSTIFSNDPKTGALTLPQLEARRKIAIALATRNRPYPKTIGEGLTALGEGLGEGMYNDQVARAEAVQAARDTAASKSLTGGVSTPQQPAGGASLESADPATQATAMAAPGMQALAYAPSSDATGEVQQPSAAVQPTQALPWTQIPQKSGMSVDELTQRYARNETGGEKDPYGTIGKEVSRSGDRAYGKYQVMGENIPIWSKQYLGTEMTPQEFLANPKAQDDLAKARGGEYLAKYGPNGAAAAWFAGENGMQDQSRSNMQSHVADYVNKFNAPLVSRDQIAASAARASDALPPAAQPTAFSPDDQQAPVQVASLSGGVPTPDTPPDPTRDAIAKSLVERQQMSSPQSQPQPQQVAQASPIGGQVPPTVPRPDTIVPTQAVPRAPATPAQPVDPGREPVPGDYMKSNPQLRQQMETARSVAGNLNIDPTIRTQATALYGELEKRANDADTRAWTVWHERTNAQQQFRMNEEKQNIDLTKARGETEDAAYKREWRQRLGGQDPDVWFPKLDKEKNSAVSAAGTIEGNQLALSALRDGVIVGSLSDMRLNAAKFRAWALNNGLQGDAASNTEVLRASVMNAVGAAVRTLQPGDPKVTDADIRMAKQGSVDPNMQLETIHKMLQRSNAINARNLNDYEDKVHSYLGGTPAERDYFIPTRPTSPEAYRQRLVEHSSNPDAAKEYNDRFGEGTAELEIGRAARRAAVQERERRKAVGGQ